jgi:acetyl esterase/lipase
MPADRDSLMSRRSVLAALAAVAAGGCSRLAFLAANLPTVFGPYTRLRDRPYGADPRQRVDVYLPGDAGPPGAARPGAARPGAARPGPGRPLVVFFHGGRWSVGNKDEYRFVGAALAGAGYVTVVAGYRLYPQVKMQGFMDDAARAVEWSLAHAAQFHADPERLYLMGHSSGAQMAAMLALDPRYFAATGNPAPRIAGVIGLSGAYDFLPLDAADLEDMFGPPDRFEDSQPIHFVHAGAPPMLLFVGLKDHTVAPKNTINFAAALRAHGDAVTLREYPKLDHADTVAALSIPARGRAPVLAEIEAFIGAGTAIPAA